MKVGENKGVGVGDGAGVGVGVGAAVGEGLGVGVTIGVGAVVGVGVDVAAGVEVGEGVGVTVGEGVGENLGAANCVPTKMPIPMLPAAITTTSRTVNIFVKPNLERSMFISPFNSLLHLARYKKLAQYTLVTIEYTFKSSKQNLQLACLNNTLMYTQLANFKDDDYTSAVAHSKDEACKLIEAGFEYVCNFSSNKIFKKRK